MRKVSSLIAAGMWLGVIAAPAQQTAGFGPILQLEKQVYVADESIRFWIGVTAPSEIPEALRASCVLHWLRPDGAKLDQPVSWPVDGNPSGWMGGWGLGKQPPSLGRYIVSFEFAGQKTPDQSFQIVTNPFSKNIAAYWTFFDTKSGGDIHARGALLRVENKTGRVLRFAKPGLIGSEVWLDVQAFEPPSMDSTFVPPSALLEADEIPAFSLQKLEWSNQSSWPMITVPPDGLADRTVELRPGYPFRDEQEYEVTISTVLTVFIGEPNDSDGALFPLRMPVSAKMHFRW